MLGKRFRRTTSMSHLGPGSPFVGTPSAHSAADSVHGATTPHSVPHKAARPSIFQAHSREFHEVQGQANAHHGGDVNMAVGTQGLALPSHKQRPCLMNEGSRAAVDGVCIGLNMEVMGPGGEENQGSSMACDGDGGSSKVGFGGSESDTMLEGSEMMMSSVQEKGPGSLMAYQMGLWIQSGINTSSGGYGSLDKKLISPVDFLDVCFYCKRRLRHERDIFIYRGDTAFCTEECRHRQIVNDERWSSRANSKRAGGARSSSSSETAVAA